MILNDRPVRRVSGAVRNWPPVVDAPPPAPPARPHQDAQPGPRRCRMQGAPPTTGQDSIPANQTAAVARRSSGRQPIQGPDDGRLRAPEPLGSTPQGLWCRTFRQEGRHPDRRALDHRAAAGHCRRSLQMKPLRRGQRPPNAPIPWPSREVEAGLCQGERPHVPTRHSWGRPDRIVHRCSALDACA